MDVTDKNEDFISFEKALSELNLREHELRKMVSEGEIKAFREGKSMKFRREDVQAFARNRTGEENLVFADALEDDTGMVTEELSEEDTLLAEDIEEEVKPVKVAPSVRRARPTAVAAVAETDVPSEPGWVTAVAVISCILCVYGLFVVFSIATGTPPQGLTGMFAG
jgi:excisionase family DNA binding protein